MNNKDYIFNEKDSSYTIINYDKKKPFASFLPGVAGINGIPMWTYYTNRGQLISSFGTINKDHSILDFNPANLAYKRTEIDGFRTFIKVNGINKELFRTNNDASKKMIIKKNSVQVEEVNDELNTTIKYFNVTNRDYPGLVRKVTFKANKDIELEFIDGLANIWPYNLSNYSTKNMSNLSVAWFDVLNLENNAPFIKNRSTTEDTSIVDDISSGNYYFSIDSNNNFLKTIVDPTIIFDNDFSNNIPINFYNNNYQDLLNISQNTTNQLLSGYSTNKINLKENETYTFYSLFSSVYDKSIYDELLLNISFNEIEIMESEAEDLINKLTKPMTIKTSNPLFDEYLKQSYLDNLLRGGVPLVFKSEEQEHIYHVFSRIHGDMEREYNDFNVSPSFYSEGNGSYRDVNQNRRNDIYFTKEAGLFNIINFLELIQIDGYNPLTIKGSTFIFNEKCFNDLTPLISSNINKLKEYLKQSFTPGSLIQFIKDEKVLLNVSNDIFIKNVLICSKQSPNAIFGTGYWSDHFTYNLDLLETYLNIFPDKLESLLFDNKVRFYQSHISVKSREMKYKLIGDKVRQVDAIYNDYDKIHKTKMIPETTNFHMDNNFNTITVSVFEKYLHLVMIKYLNLDQMKMGIMMEADKPGWNDAMNGLPSIFGSGLNESVALYKLLDKLENFILIFNDKKIKLNNDLYELYLKLNSEYDADFNNLQNIKEQFLEKTRYFIDNETVNIVTGDLFDFIKKLKEVVYDGINKSINNNGLLPTYLTYSAESYTIDNDIINVKHWKQRKLPLFLEGINAQLKISTKSEALTIYNKVKETEIFDKQLGIYLTSESLDDETLEIGRIRAFTKGWLERESSFLHMSYKYLVSLLKTELYDEFYDTIKTQMPPFLDPNKYGRSVLENVSFIASSSNPNTSHIGRGFVSRLTGSTSEAITMIYLILLGNKPFEYINNQLRFKVFPKVKKEMFLNNEIKFMFLSNINITIINESNKDDTFCLKPHKYILKNNKEQVTINGDIIIGKLAKDIRKLKYDEILVYI